MFKKIIGLVGLAGIVAVGAGVGCTVTEVTTTTDSGTSPEASSTATTPKPDGGNKDAAPASCYEPEKVPNAAALDLAGPVANSGKCTPAQQASLIADCIDNNTASQEKCGAFENNAANAACLKCAFGPGQGDDVKTVPMGALISGDTFTLLNIEACGAAVLGNSACAKKFSEQTVCQLLTCNSCEDNESINECFGESSKGACAAKNDAACDKVLSDGKAQWEAACRGADFDASVKKVLAVLCGGGGSDAGTD